jgi:hypothetical protein
MPKSLVMGIGQALLIAGVQPASIVDVEFEDATPTETVALEIDNTTEQPAIVAKSTSWLETDDNKNLFTADNRLVEYADE